MIKVTYDPGPNVPGPTGVVSFCSWENPALHKALREAFNESPREKIVEIVIDKQGIKARFEPKNSPS